MTVKGLEPGKRPALLISEMQNGITDRAFRDTPLAEQVATRGIVGKINALSAGFRERGFPVIHCTITARADFYGWNRNCVLAARIFREGNLVSGSHFAAIHDDIVVGGQDIVSERHHGMAAFTGTDLASTLRGLGIDTVVFCGVSTNVALMGGSVEAVGHGYTSVIAEDSAAGGTAETHQIQVTMHLPLVATVSRHADIIEALG
ncbi:cysteine hydrolase [Sphingopyxis sp.]|uniref:cysteine hydrolase n=1 Tax=Sphingopyxis sp. TaxID=1908224 RepID=UPI001DD80E59|nr:cysteine hydrolase [Sphingopyxis sp.]MBW8297066.1 cysteine hydrolase [Sphingopyxis sp.]